MAGDIIDTNPEVKPEVKPEVTDQSQASGYAKGAEKELEGLRNLRELISEEARRTKPETDELAAKRKRLEKSRRLIATLADGISALANLYHTTRGAPNVYDPANSQRSAVDKRIEELRKRREKERDRHLAYKQKESEYDMQEGALLRQLEAEAEARELARKKAEREADEHRWKEALQPYLQQEAYGKSVKESNLADKAGWDAQRSKTQAEYEPERQKAELKLTNAKTATEGTRQAANRAQATNSYASAKAHEANAGKNTWHFMGQTYHNKDEYEKAVLRAEENSRLNHKQTHDDKERASEARYKDHNGVVRYYNINELAAKREKEDADEKSLNEQYKNTNSALREIGL